MDVSTILRTSKRDKVDEYHFQSCFGLHMVVSKIISNPCFVFFRRLFRLYIFYRPTLFWTSGGHFQQYTSPCAFTMLDWLTLWLRQFGRVLRLFEFWNQCRSSSLSSDIGATLINLHMKVQEGDHLLSSKVNFYWLCLLM